MADISQELARILAAVYGKEVRGSIHDAIDKINEVGEKVMTVGTAVTGPTSSSEGFFTASLYLNSDTMELWKCTGTNAWASQGILKGEDGDPGPAGEDGKDGNSWYRGTGISGKSANPTVYSSSGVADANVNDFYLNPSEGAVYHCVSGGVPSVATWSYDFTMTGGGGGGASSWNDLTDKPFNSVNTSNGLTTTGGVLDVTMPTVDQTYGSTSSNAQSGKAVASAISGKADSATSLAGYGITNAYTKSEVDTALSGKADSATTLAGYGITDAYTKTEVDTALVGKANTSQLDEWTSEQALGANNTVTFSGLNDNLAYDLYCDAVGAGIQSITKNGTSLTYVLTGSSLLVGTTKCKLRIVK